MRTKEHTGKGDFLACCSSLGFAFIAVFLMGCDLPLKRDADGGGPQRQEGRADSLVTHKQSSEVAPVSTTPTYPRTELEREPSSAESKIPAPGVQDAERDSASQQPTEEELKALQLTYARLINEMGTGAERQQLQGGLLGELDDRAMAEMVISWYLSEGNAEDVRQQLSQADLEPGDLPSWERLTLALKEKNAAAVQALVRDPDNGLTPLARVNALRQLGLDSDALELAHEYLERDPEAKDTAALQQQKRSLALKLAKRVVLGMDFRSFGSLDITTARGLFDFKVENNLVELKVAANQLDANSNEFFSDEFSDELDLSVKAMIPHNSSEEFEAIVGGNLRDDGKDSILYGQFAWIHSFNRRLSGQIRGAYNEISTETPALRALGTRSRLSTVLLANISPWDFASAQLDLQRYQTRDNDKLAQGYGVEAAVGHFLRKGRPSWLVRLQGAWDDNDLDGSLPSDLLATVVPDYYGQLGVGTTLRYGMATREASDKFYALADGWAGWVWPADALGFSGRMGLGTSFFGRDSLNFNAFYSNTQGGDTSQAYLGVGLDYSYLF